METNLLKKIDFSDNDPVINDLLKINEESDNSTNDDFPVHVFPQAVQNIINEANKALKFPKSYLSGSMLFATSVALGNSYRVKVMTGWVEPAILYLINVGSAGANKTHPTKFALNPLFDMDKQSYKAYKVKQAQYKEDMNMSRKERQESGRPEPVKPTWEKYLVSDFTPEGLAKIHEFNPRSIGVYSDEALAWISNFNRYSKGSESQFWLSNWSSAPVIIDRKGDDSILMHNTFISVVGSIQPSMLMELAKENRTNNGFLDRLLFIYPENIRKEYWTDDELSPEVSRSWNQIVSRITQLEYSKDMMGNHISKEVTFSAAGKARLFEFQRANTDLSHQQDEKLKSVYTKLENTAIRLSLILHVMKWGCDEGGIDGITAETVENAITLTEYFRQTAIKVNSIISNVDPADSLVPNKKEFIESLPDGEFETKAALGIAAAMTPPVSQRTAERILKDKALFTRVRFGVYAKK